MDHYIDNSPGSPTSLLNLLASTSTQIDYFSDSIIQEVKEGNASALKVLVQLKAMEIATKRIRTEIKDNVLTESDKYPGDKFNFLGNELSKGDVHTEYDYSKCGDTEWELLQVEVQQATERLKERETFLKALKEPIVMADTLTGEMVTVSPPIKKSTPGVKISIR
jgi:hypothetical protein